jgi:hypothetical protein
MTTGMAGMTITPKAGSFPRARKPQPRDTAKMDTMR